MLPGFIKSGSFSIWLELFSIYIGECKILSKNKNNSIYIPKLLSSKSE